MRLIQLTRGQTAKVDDDLYDWLNGWKWCALWNAKRRCYYAVRRDYQTGGKPELILMHRLVMDRKKGDGTKVDHRNFNTLDNQRDNLRVCTNSQNLANRGPQADNASGYKGVYLNKRLQKWCAAIKAGGKTTYLGSFVTAQEAAAAYNEAARNLHGVFAYQNPL